MSSTTEPYDVVEALRALNFTDKDAVVEWLNTPNPDIDNQTPSLLMMAGQYDDVIRAIVLEAGRRGIKQHHPELAE